MSNRGVEQAHDTNQLLTAANPVALSTAALTEWLGVDALYLFAK